MERGAWEELPVLAAALGIKESLLPDLHKKSIVWVAEILPPTSNQPVAL
jgi:hypothetical protein